MFSRQRTVEAGEDPRHRSARNLSFRLRAEVAGTGAWTYNGRVPGPLMRLRPGDRMHVEVENGLPSLTTFQWRHSAQQGDARSVPVAIDPGDRRYIGIEPTAPGLYWYHAGDSEQIERGLYGAMLVDDPFERRALGIPPENDKILLLHCVRGTRPGMPPAVMVNGRHQPVLNVRNGVLQRLRFLNVGPCGPIRVSLGGRQPIWTLALERTTGLELGPGQGADLLWLPSGDHGERVPLRWCGPVARRAARSRHHTTGVVADFCLIGHRGAAPRAGEPPMMFGTVPAGRIGSCPAVKRGSGSVALSP